MRSITKRNWGTRLLAVACAVALCLGVCGALAGCSGNQEQSQGGSSSQTSETREFTDSLGRTVEVPAQIDKIAPSGFVAQQVLLAVAPDKMVGLGSEITDEQAQYLGSEYADLPIFGAAFGASDTLNKEAVAEAGAQILIDVGEPKDGMEEDLDNLQEQLGIPCVFIESSISTYDETYRTLGELLGVEDKGNEIADYCKRVYDETQAVVDSIPEAERANVAYLVGDSGLNAIAQGSYQGQVVDMTANNVVVVDNPSGKGNGNEVSLEQLAVWDPELIVFQSEDMYNSVASDPAWSSLTAIASGNYYLVPDTPYTWLNNPPSVNQVLGMQWLPRICYPDAFDDDLQDVVAEYYKVFYNHDLTQAEYDELTAGATPKA